MLFLPDQPEPAGPPPPATAAGEMRWLRSHSDPRQHAVYVEARGGYWFYCGRYAKYDRAFPKPENELRRDCHECKTRIRNPYLIPEVLTKLKAEERKA